MANGTSVSGPQARLRKLAFQLKKRNQQAAIDAQQRELDNADDVEKTLSDMSSDAEKLESERLKLENDIASEQAKAQQVEAKKAGDRKTAAVGVLSGFADSARKAGSVGARNAQQGATTSDPNFQNLLNQQAQGGAFGTTPFDVNADPATVQGMTTVTREPLTRRTTGHPGLDAGFALAKMLGLGGPGGTTTETIKSVNIPSPYEVKLRQNNLNIAQYQAKQAEALAKTAQIEADIAARTKGDVIATRQAQRAAAEATALSATIQSEEDAMAFTRVKTLSDLGVPISLIQEPVSTVKARLIETRTKFAAKPEGWFIEKDGKFQPVAGAEEIIATAQRDHIAAHDGQSFELFGVDRKGNFDPHTVSANRIMGLVAAMQSTATRKRAIELFAAETGLVFDGTDWKIDPNDTVNEFTQQAILRFVQNQPRTMEIMADKEAQVPNIKPGTFTRNVPGAAIPVDFKTFLREPPIQVETGELPVKMQEPLTAGSTREFLAPIRAIGRKYRKLKEREEKILSLFPEK